MHVVIFVSVTFSRMTVPGSVTGVVGLPVSVPCDLTPPSPGDSPHLILWYKNIFGTPIYSVDMRNGLESASHWRDRTVFGDRVKFVVHNKNSSITSELRFNTVRSRIQRFNQGLEKGAKLCLNPCFFGWREKRVGWL